MKTFKRYMKAIRYGLETNGPFCWDCYGVEARYYDSRNTSNDWDASMIADSVTHKVYEISLTHRTSDTALRWINPKYKKAFKAESKEKGFSWKQAWDDVEYKEVSKKEILKEIKNAFAGRLDVSEPNDIRIPHDYEVKEINIQECCENDDGSLDIAYTIQPTVAESIINQWIMNTLVEKANEVIEKYEQGKRATREMAEKEGSSSFTVEEDEIQWHNPIFVFGDDSVWC
jgi:hypothetical protein